MIKVFLAEDEVIMRNGIKRNIPWEKEGFLFVGDASDGELAWPLIKNTKPDILITDIRMPFMNGLELAEQGMAVMFISSEIEEMIRTCSRMAVLRDGSKVGELEESELQQNSIMKAIAGGGN